MCFGSGFITASEGLIWNRAGIQFDLIGTISNEHP